MSDIDMYNSELIFTFFYILMCICFVYPPTEFVSIGFTIEQIFAKLLGSEEVEFIRYHQKRTSLTLFVHASLPGIYLIIHFLQFYDDNINYNTYKDITFKVFQNISLAAIVFIPALISNWTQHNWKNHPISKCLRRFSNSPGEYATIAADINTEFRRQGVLTMKQNAVTNIITTENWIIKTTPYFVHFAHQSDTTLNVNQSETYQIAPDTYDSVQIINILVKPGREGVKEFSIRINALDFRLLQDCINQPITISTNIQFHRSIIDRFVEVFKEQVALNPIFKTNQTSETCFACMLVEPNIKLQKNCLDEHENGEIIPEADRCKNCYCKPMWCVDCLAKWFASRQNELEKDVWLQKKCSCPLCRAPFCILDVCYIEKLES